MPITSTAPPNQDTPTTLTPAQTAAATAAGTDTNGGAAVDYTSASSIEAAAQAGLSDNITQAIWAAALLLQIDAQPSVANSGENVPITLNNIENIERWMVAEEPSSNWFDRMNPLNASLNTGSADGTGSYANLSDAASNTAAMIAQPNMADILDALIDDAPAPTFSAAVVSSPWASSHYGVAAAGAPAKYVQPGRSITYISSIPLPAQVSAGTGKEVLPADAGAANPESDGLPTLSTVGELGTLLSDITDVAFWKRVGIFMGGSVLVILGVAIFISTTKPGQEATSVAAMAALA